MKPKERYKKLKYHLLQENKILVDAIDEYEKLDKIAKKIGFLEENKTFTQDISWWPLISVLGTFSSGKSSFINEYIDQNIQSTGNQAVDDKFTVVCYSNTKDVITLPGIALDADPRFPFYNISKEIEKIDSEANINKYLQLKGVNSENIKGKILIDSPGFDADTQRDEILKITEHIIDISDLVMIFFDARHPEPGAMRDTLNHLVEVSKNHKDSDKVLYILNQIDTCSKENNLEDIIGSWQRALAQKGIVSGKFYAIYNESVATIEDENLKRKKEKDLQEILEKMDNVLIDRSYRIIKNIKTKAKDMLNAIPRLKEKLNRFKNTLLIFDIAIFILLALGLFFINELISSTNIFYAIVALFILVFIFLHFKAKSFISKFIAKRVDDEFLKQAFIFQTKWYKPYLLAPSRVTNRSIKNSLEKLIEDSKLYIQRLNDQFITFTHKEAK
ncbi:MAG TPA: dynamin family protein [Campylobacterales bacterium]|nr:dynamin family protein [Campylobacterales bacterium]